MHKVKIVSTVRHNPSASFGRCKRSTHGVSVNSRQLQACLCYGRCVEVLRSLGVVSWTRIIKALSNDGKNAEAVKVFQRMLFYGIHPDKITFVTVLGVCSWHQGRVIQACIFEAGLGSELIVSNAIMNFLSKCGDLDATNDVFRRSSERDVISWTTVVVANSQHGHHKEAMNFFRTMLQDGTAPSSFTLVAVLNVCAGLASSKDGRLVLSLVAECGLATDVSILTATINMYGKCGRLDDALELLHRMEVRGVVAWTAILSAFARYGFFGEALERFQEMQLDGVRPNRVTFLAAMEACMGVRSFAIATVVHSSVLESGLDTDNFTANALVSMYSSCGSLESAEAVFWGMLDADVVSWNGMIAAYAQHEQPEAAMRTFREMQARGTGPNNVSFLNVLEACSCSDHLNEGRKIHFCVRESGLDGEAVVRNSLAAMYMRCDCLQDVCAVFASAQELTTVSWVIMIAAYAQDGQSCKALDCFRIMLLDGLKPEAGSFARLLGCSMTLAEGRSIHACIDESTLEIDGVLEAALVTMYSRCGSLEAAEFVFSSLLQQGRGLTAFASMIKACVEHKRCEKALHLFRHAQLQGAAMDAVIVTVAIGACVTRGALGACGRSFRSWIVEGGWERDAFVANALVAMYANCGEMTRAEEVFSDEPDVVSWTELISGYSQLGRYMDAIRLFESMLLRGVMPDRVSFLSVIDACAAGTRAREGRLIHALVVEAGLLSDVIVANSLLNMYCKCGKLEAALETFPSRAAWDVLSWTTVIALMCAQGRCPEALLDLFRSMQLQGVSPDSITFVNIFSAYAGAGLVEAAVELFVTMESDYSLAHTLESCGCMVDVLGKVGWLDEAEEFIGRMAIKPDVTLWMSLLGASNLHWDVHRATRAAHSVLKLDPNNSAALVAVSNAHAVTNHN